MDLHWTVEQIAQLQKQLSAARIEMWLTQVGHWHWWILFAMFTVPWAVAYKFADRSQIHALAMMAALTAVTVITLDELGFAFTLWNYPVDLLPVFPRLTCVDYSGLPVSFMLLYQYFPTWNSYFKALVIFSAVASFCAEPTLVWLGLYVLVKWYYWYSFPIYIIMGLFLRWAVVTLIDIELASHRRL